jgi:DNA repair protein RadC
MQLELFRPEVVVWRPRKARKRRAPQEWKVIALRECPLPEHMLRCETPQHAVEYWRAHVERHTQFDPERECLVALHLNTRRRIRGHHFVSIGSQDTILVHPREVFRTALIAAAAAIVVMHNHPSGEPTPSEGDIKATRDLIRAGQLMRIELLDHVIVGRPNYCSLRELGYFYT